MILQKDLIAESGLKEDAAVTVLKRLRRKGEITAGKDRFQHNQISYSTEDAEKIRQEFARVKTDREKSAKERPPEEGKKENKDDRATFKGGPSSTQDKSAKDFVEQPGPDKTTVQIEGKDEKKEEKAVPLYKNPIVLVGAGLLLLLGLVWLYQQRLKKQQAESKQQVESRASEVARPALADQYRII